MPAASTAALYAVGSPAVAAADPGAGRRGRGAAAADAADPAAPRTWIRSPASDRPRRTRRFQARATMSSTVRVTRRARCGDDEELEGGRHAGEPVRGPVARPHVAPHVDAVGSGDAEVGQADRLGRTAAVGSGDARDRDGEGRSEALPCADSHRPGDLGAHGPVVGDELRGDAELGRLDPIGVGHDTAQHVPARVRGCRSGCSPPGRPCTIPPWPR